MTKRKPTPMQSVPTPVRIAFRALADALEEHDVDAGTIGTEALIELAFIAYQNGGTEREFLKAARAAFAIVLNENLTMRN